MLCWLLLLLTFEFGSKACWIWQSVYIVDVIAVPEQLTFSVTLPWWDFTAPHSTSEDSEPTQEDGIIHPGLLEELELNSVEMAEPQFNCRHTTDDDILFQSNQANTRLQSPWCCSSSAPLQSLLPPTNLTSPESVQGAIIIRCNFYVRHVEDYNLLSVWNICLPVDWRVGLTWRAEESHFHDNGRQVSFWQTNWRGRQRVTFRISDVSHEVLHSDIETSDCIIFNYFLFL